MRFDYIIGIEAVPSGGMAVYHNGEFITRTIDEMEDSLKGIKNGVAVLQKIKPTPLMHQQVLDCYDKTKETLTKYAIPYVLLRPEIWQCALNVRGKCKESRFEKKERFAAKCIELFDYEPDFHESTAILLMRFAMDKGYKWLFARLPLQVQKALLEEKFAMR